MEKFWELSLAIGGISAIGAFIFYSLYKKWLSLDIFSKMTQKQTFEIMKFFLSLTFAALFFFISLYAVKSNSTQEQSSTDNHLFDLQKAWEGVNEIDCEELITPDVVKASSVMELTATTWNNDIINKSILLKSYFRDFEILFLEMDKCEKKVPGYKKERKCSEFISENMRTAYVQMKSYKENGHE